VRGGTQGVGRATTSAAVVGSVLIIVADAFFDETFAVSLRQNLLMQEPGRSNDRDVSFRRAADLPL